MPDHKPPPRHPLPPQSAWDRFCDEVDVASQILARLAPARPPLERLSPAQYACGKYLAAMDELLRALGAPRHIRELAALPARAWHNASWGIPDPLFAPTAIGGRKAADVPMTVFRAWAVKLADELAAERQAWRVAAQEVSSALRRRKAPKGCTPSAKSIQNWHGKATDPQTETDHHLAQAYAHYRSRPWPEAAGETLDERVQWIVAGYRMLAP